MREEKKNGEIEREREGVTDREGKRERDRGGRGPLKR